MGFLVLIHNRPLLYFLKVILNLEWFVVCIVEECIKRGLFYVLELKCQKQRTRIRLIKALLVLLIRLYLVGLIPLYLTLLI